MITRTLRVAVAAICLVTLASFALREADATSRTITPARASDPAGIVLALPAMGRARAAHTATPLSNGAVLIAGGMSEGSDSEGAMSTAELYDLRSARFVSAGTMREGRQSHTASVLADGRVLIAGGFRPDGSYLSSAELYDPRTGRFMQTGAMRAARAGHVAVTLPDGRVLVAGGVGTGWTFLASAEIYDPATGRFVESGAMSVARESHTATLLADSTVLVVGGHAGRRASIAIYASAERFDLRANRGRGAFRRTSDMARIRHKHDAVRLADGRVLVTGGADARDERGAYRAAEIYDPVTDKWTATGDMRLTRYKHAGTSILLADGTVVVTGGAAAPERYDPASGTFTLTPLARGAQRMSGSFSAAAPIRVGRKPPASTEALPDAALITGGYGGGRGATASAWLFRSSNR